MVRGVEGGGGKGGVRVSIIHYLPEFQLKTFERLT